MLQESVQSSHYLLARSRACSALAPVDFAANKRRTSKLPPPHSDDRTSPARCSSKERRAKAIVGLGRPHEPRVERGAAAASSEQVVEEHSAEQEVEEHSAGPAEDCGHDYVPDDEVAHGLPSLGVHDGAFGPRAN